jgi:hypothetical protein
VAAPQNICSQWVNHESQGAAHRNIAVRCTFSDFVQKTYKYCAALLLIRNFDFFN